MTRRGRALLMESTRVTRDAVAAALAGDRFAAVDVLNGFQPAPPIDRGAFPLD